MAKTANSVGIIYLFFYYFFLFLKNKGLNKEISNAAFYFLRQNSCIIGISFGTA